MPAANSGLAKVAVSFSADKFVVKESSVLRINICGENRHYAKPQNVSGKPYHFVSQKRFWVDVRFIVHLFVHLY
jgi:hypothetical protein